MKLYFYGGAGDVTGSNYVLESGSTRLMIDCGLHQGGHFAERQNFDPLPYKASDIEAVCVTHAHLDHTGKLPKLYLEGFRGTIHSTPPTRDLAELVLLDSEHILGKEAEREHVENFCTEPNITHVMEHWQTNHYHEPFTVGPFTITFFDAGHVLGSSIIRVEAEGKTVVFSGDLGNYPAPIVKMTETIESADYCLIESTYGNRVHEPHETIPVMLEDVIEDSVRRGGTLMIPSFALERTQELLYELHELFEKGRVTKVPVFIDSPLAIKMTAVYRKYESYFNPEMYHMVKSGDDILNFPGLHLTLTTEQSKEINSMHGAKIVVAGSGMSNGGRILHHEQRYLSDPKSTILFIGYQAQGTLGRQIMDGAASVTIFGEPVPVRCVKRAITGFSAHADQPRLLKWISPMKTTLKKAFVVQGENDASMALAQLIRDNLAVDVVVPKIGDVAVL